MSIGIEPFEHLREAFEYSLSKIKNKIAEVPLRTSSA
jgi:hypothetical protein